MDSTHPRFDVVLLGVGHTHSHVLWQWRLTPIDHARLTCVSDFPLAAYSGMLPGVLSGQYEPERMQIDVLRSCAAAGANLILGQATGLDRAKRQILFADRPPLPYDVLSVGIGSVPACKGVEIAEDVALPIKPLQTFLPRLESRLRAIVEGGRSRLQIAVVGGGVAGVEITFCLPARIQRLFGSLEVQQTLVESGPHIASGLTDGTRRRIERELAVRGIRVVTGRRVYRVDAEGLEFADGERQAADLVLWVTSAAAPPLLLQLGLPTDERGFLRTRATLQTVTDDHVFAVGDAGSIAGEHLAKAGVHAVRQGPVLWENLRRTLAREPLLTYRPQRDFLKLLNLGDGRAIGEYRGWSFAGRWCLWLKDFIDRRYMDRWSTGP